ncbi:YkvA family protein [Herpetosiphon sp. NSE202]|uniref:YkvA family protein n=1 Tax=Herpetosiphon sp. NSE202 TaxID=3351349 RepID=UPI0036453571
MKQQFARWQQRARHLKQQISVLLLAWRDPRVPWYAKVLALCTLGYAFSPIDLIPDFIPVLGYVDDLLLLPLGIMLTIKLIPNEVWHEYSLNVQQSQAQTKPVSYLAASLIIGLWLGIVWFVFHNIW